MVIKKIILLMSVASVTGCVAPINTVNSTKYAQAASRATISGDWENARRYWARAVKNGESGKIAKKQQAIFYYEYGRASGVTCFYDIAETYLNKAYELDKKIGGPYFKSLIEMFRLNLVQKKYEKAVYYFEKALPELERLNAAKKSPAEFSKLLSEYTIALKNTGRVRKANKIKKRSFEIQKKAVRSITEKTPYGAKCFLSR